ncbi:glycosyltransferase family 4 protein [Cetobacterium ceti]
MKLLIYNTDILKNTGGPSGYLYNLEKGLKNNKNIKFLMDIDKSLEILKKRKKKWIQNFKILIKKNKYLSKKILIKNIQKKIYHENLNNYDMIHFHSTLSFFNARENDAIKKTIKILTSHSPQPLYEELLENYFLKESDLNKKELEILKRMDYYSFENADYIIFPCLEAMEPYLKRDLKLKKILNKKLEEKKIKFLLSGIEEKEIQDEEDYFFKKFKIPKESIVFSYIGRHNKIKGYDILVEASRIILNKYNNVYFIVGGKKNNKLESLEHPNYLNLGWTKEGDNIIKNADGFILPNRETYFDLVFLEALRANARIICSETGGNKYFKRYKSEEIFYFKENDPLELTKILEELIKKMQEKKLAKKENRKIYEEYFTNEIFGKNYLKIMEEIYEKN